MTGAARTRAGERGSIVAYILMAIFLTGLLVATMMSGSQKSATSRQVDELLLRLQADIKTVQGAVTECAATYSQPVDVDGDNDTDADDNPNPPFPIYCPNETCTLSEMTSGPSGTNVTDIGCPGAPDGQRYMFGPTSFALFRDLENTTMEVTYINDADEGIYLHMVPVPDDPIWREAFMRLEERYSKCAATVVTANPDARGVNCTKGCFYYWILRRPTSDPSIEASCP